MTSINGRRMGLAAIGLGTLLLAGTTSAFSQEPYRIGALNPVSGAGNTYGSVAGVHDLPNGGSYAADYQAAVGKAPGAYSALAFACAQIALAALDTAIAGGAADSAAIREGTRAAVVAGTPVETILGPLVVDPNGDSGTWLSF